MSQQENMNGGQAFQPPPQGFPDQTGQTYQNYQGNTGNYYGGPYPPPPPPPPAVKTVFNSVEKAFSILIFPIAFLLLRFTLYEAPSFVTTAVFMLLTTAMIGFMKRSGKKFTANSILTASAMYIFSAVYSITDDGFLKFLNTVFMLLLSVYFCYSTGSGFKGIPRYLPSVMTQGMFDYPISNMGKQPKAVSQATGGSGIFKRILIIIAALMLTAPLTLIVASLLISADENMAKMLDGLFDFIFSKGIWYTAQQLILSIPLACYIFGMMYSNVHRIAERDASNEKWQRKLLNSRRISDLALCTAATPLCVMYLLFFISQASYLMSAFSGTLPDNFSYAEYARRGFFELLWIALINLAVIIFLNLLAKRNSPAAVKFYSILICFFTLVVIASALSKMVMYISVYGLTRLRLFTGWFMALIALVFIFIIIRQFTPKLNLSAAVSVTFTLMFALLVFARPDFVIAKYNTYMDKNGKLDYYRSDYLLELSDDALCVYLSEGCDDGEKTRDALELRGRMKDDSITSRWNISSILVERQIK